MMRLFFSALLVSVATAGCSMWPSSTSTPTSPTTGSDAIAPFAGTWKSGSGSTTGSTPQACQNVTYTVTPTSANAASVTYAATCSGIPIAGTGAGTAHGSILDWTANGTAGVCPFSLSGTATPQAAANLNVKYAGTMCGVPVSGTTVLMQ
jgi:hypothetical protein